MSAECGRNHPGPCAWVGKGGPLEPLCLQPERPEPPVTADHTPERLSAEERDALSEAVKGHSHPLSVERPLFAAVEAILTARLADQAARLAEVEALADRWDPPGWKATMSSGMTLKRCADQLRAALHPDPSEGADA